MPQLQDAKAQPNLPLSISHSPDTKKPGNSGLFSNNGGEGGIRTPDTGLGYTPLAGERLRPLGHLS